MNKIIWWLIVLVVIIGGYFLIFGQKTVDLPDQGVKDGVVQMSIKDFSFEKPSVQIKVGTTVVWTNVDSVEHTVASDEGNILDSELLGEGETYSYTFNKTGTFNYHCTPHPYMKGEVIVEE